MAEQEQDQPPEDETRAMVAGQYHDFESGQRIIQAFRSRGLRAYFANLKRAGGRDPDIVIDDSINGRKMMVFGQVVIFDGLYPGAYLIQDPEQGPWAQVRYDATYELKIELVRKETLKAGFTPEHGARSRRITTIASHQIHDESMVVLVLRAQALIGLMEEKGN